MGESEAAGPDEPDAARSFEISLAQWSLHRALRGQGGERIDHLEFPVVARSLGFSAVEYVNQFFADQAENRGYLVEMKKVADDEGVRSLLIMCDGEGDLGDADGARRRTAVENHYKWVTAARFLGCHSIRVNAASTGNWNEQKDRAAEGLRRLTEFAAQHEIDVLVENHGGLSSNGEWLAGVIREVDHPRCGTLPDFGNFKIRDGEEYDRYRGMTELMPFAKAVSAKSHDFDDEGEEIHTDYLRMMRIVLESGYRGFVGIEYEGKKLREREGILATRRLLERVREQLG